MAIKERVYLTNIKWRGVGKKKKLTSKLPSAVNVTNVLEDIQNCNKFYGFFTDDLVEDFYELIGDYLYDKYGYYPTSYTINWEGLDLRQIILIDGYSDKVLFIETDAPKWMLDQSYEFACRQLTFSSFLLELFELPVEYGFSMRLLKPEEVSPLRKVSYIKPRINYINIGGDYSKGAFLVKMSKKTTEGDEKDVFRISAEDFPFSEVKEKQEVTAWLLDKIRSVSSTKYLNSVEVCVDETADSDEMTELFLKINPDAEIKDGFDEIIRRWFSSKPKGMKNEVRRRF